jgi:predicted XRE-type DNA-binding protein
MPMSTSRSKRSPAVTFKTELAAKIAAHVEDMGVTQAEAAQELALTQSRLNALLKGRMELFSLEALVDIAVRAGFTVRLSAARPYRQD